MIEITDRLSRLEEGQYRQDEKLGNIETRLRQLETIAEFGKGAAWVLLKLGALSATLTIIGVAIWEKVRSSFQ